MTRRRWEVNINKTGNKEAGRKQLRLYPCAHHICMWGVTSQLHASTTLRPWETAPLLIEQEAWWAQEPVWTLCGRNKLGPPAENVTRIPQMSD